MKRIAALFLGIIFILVLISGCSGKSGDAPKADTPAVQEVQEEPSGAEVKEEPAGASLEGELCETERFSIIAPKEWKVLELPPSAGFQLYKSSGEAIQVQYTGSNQNDEAAKREAERFAKDKSGTEPVEVEILGKKFWATTFEYDGAEQAFYGRMEDGVMLSIQTSKGNYENTKEYADIINSIVFK